MQVYCIYLHENKLLHQVKPKFEAFRIVLGSKFFENAVLLADSRYLSNCVDEQHLFQMIQIKIFQIFNNQIHLRSISLVTEPNRVSQKRHMFAVLNLLTWVNLSTAETETFIRIIC